MESNEAFQNALKTVDTLTQRPSNEQLLKLYALYKQATHGDNDTERPGGFDFKAAAKYNAWEKFKGESKENAMKAYIDLVNELKSAES
ncbi:acyl-CoA-binding protein [Roseivirga seohaensis subsp. aquiponti]|uniref:Acyl-CoA-binding protein n=1 Tax=Roseivirga seohaensis subsp. aquiponti TaxID=1566026 RepID=A0A0L8AQG7_9BACT|nr:acyl-CoA-binding protein [Roseivirga seohaensis]KOF04437.1 acyl-CoA-binding protein [Roseivirga seohaensis subsp. aquiponti]